MDKSSRNKFLLGLGLAAVAAFFKWGGKQPPKKKTAKFLTQDGRLVEIEVDKLPSSGRAATRDDLQNWIKK